MTSLRHFVICLAGSGVILALGLLLLSLTPAWGLPFIGFALAVAGWSFGAYRQQKWAWYVAFCFAWMFAVLFAVGTLALSVSLVVAFSSSPETRLAIILVVACAVAALVGIIFSLRRSLWYLNEERAVFFPGLTLEQAISGEARPPQSPR